MITTAELQSLTRQSLAEMARDIGIAGRSSMNKDELIEAIGKSKASAGQPNESAESPTRRSSKSGKGSEPAPATTKSSRSKRAKTASSVTNGSPATNRKGGGKASTATSKAGSRSATGKATTRPITSDSAKSKSKRSAPAAKSASKSASPATKAAKKLKGDGGKTTAAKASGRGSAAKSTSKSGGKSSGKSAPAPAQVSAKSKRIREEMRRRSERAMQNKDISNAILVAGSAIRGSTGQSEQTPHKDRVALIVRDSYWLQADWEITRAAVERVRVAMNEKWHSAQPVLRLMAVGDASSNRAEQLIRDIPIHGGVSNWYIDVDEPPSRFRVVIGYLAESERFYPLCRSNIVETPKPDAVNRLDRHWRDIAEDYERIYSLSGGFDANSGGELKEVFEARLQRPMPSRQDDGSGSDTDAALDRHRALPFEVDAELIIFGSTTPGATVLLSGEPVKLRDDGTFTVRVALPDKRQVLPVIAQSRDSMRQRTTVIAVERNTKVMEAVERDQNF